SSRPFPSVSHFGDRPNLHRAVELEDRASQGELGGVGQVLGLDQRVAAHEVLLGVRPVGDRLLLSLHHLAAAVERLAGVLYVPLLLQLLQPRHPLLHLLLHLGRGLGPLSATVQENELAHDAPPSGWSLLVYRCLGPSTTRRVRSGAPDNYFSLGAR